MRIVIDVIGKIIGICGMALFALRGETNYSVVALAMGCFMMLISQKRVVLTKED